MIRFSGVTKRFGGTVALDAVSLQVERGTLTALVGASGSGKSTLLRLVNRLVERDAGGITLDGTDIATLDPVTLRRRIGYVIQSVGLFPHWTVAENVAAVPRLLGWERARIAARVAEMLALVGLPSDGFAARRPHELSGGQQQRVGVARALAADPDMLLMDEPFGALDPETRTGLQDELRRIHRETGKTILLVTHDADEALRLADRIVLMEHGRIVQEGTPAALLADEDPRLVAFFGGVRAGLRRLAFMPVRPLVRTEPAPLGVPEIPASANAETALAAMLAEHCTALAVSDAGRIVGSLRLADLVAGR